MILGGYGATGRSLIRHLLAQTEYEVVIAGRNHDKAQAFVESLHDPRLTARHADAADPHSLQEPLRGVDYLDVQYSDRKLEGLSAQEQEMCRKGLCFVTKAGYHPGLPSAKVRYAATKLDRIESARVACYLNMGKLAYTEAVDELMEGFAHYQAWRPFATHFVRARNDRVYCGTIHASTFWIILSQ